MVCKDDIILGNSDNKYDVAPKKPNSMESKKPFFLLILLPMRRYVANHQHNSGRPGDFLARHYHGERCFATMCGGDGDSAHTD